MTADHCRTSDHRSLRPIITEICGETSDLRFYTSSSRSSKRQRVMVYLEWSAVLYLQRMMICGETERSAVLYLLLTHYSDLRSSKPKIMLICGDLRFLGRPLLMYSAHGRVHVSCFSTHTSRVYNAIRVWNALGLRKLNTAVLPFGSNFAIWLVIDYDLPNQFSSVAKFTDNRVWWRRLINLLLLLNTLFMFTYDQLSLKNREVRFKLSLMNIFDNGNSLKNIELKTRTLHRAVSLR